MPKDLKTNKQFDSSIPLSMNVLEPHAISKDYAEQHKVPTGEFDKDGNPIMRPLKPGDKIIDAYGNKQIIDMVIDRNMSQEEAKQKGISDLVELFKANPNLNIIPVAMEQPMTDADMQLMQIVQDITHKKSRQYESSTNANYSRTSDQASVLREKMAKHNKSPLLQSALNGQETQQENNAEVSKNILDSIFANSKEKVPLKTVIVSPVLIAALKQKNHTIDNGSVLFIGKDPLIKGNDTALVRLVGNEFSKITDMDGLNQKVFGEAMISSSILMHMTASEFAKAYNEHVQTHVQESQQLAQSVSMAGKNIVEQMTQHNKSNLLQSYLSNTVISEVSMPSITIHSTYAIDMVNQLPEIKTIVDDTLGLTEDESKKSEIYVGASGKHNGMAHIVFAGYKDSHENVIKALDDAIYETLGVDASNALNKNVQNVSVDYLQNNCIGSIQSKLTKSLMSKANQSTLLQERLSSAKIQTLNESFAPNNTNSTNLNAPTF